MAAGWFDQRDAARAIGQLVYCNPFSADRVALERRILGERLGRRDTYWSHDQARVEDPVLSRIAEIAEAQLLLAQQRSAEGQVPLEDDVAIFSDLVLYGLYARFEPNFLALIEGRGDASFYPAFQQALYALRGVARLEFRSEHLFALFFQIRRAFHATFLRIVGGSAAAAMLREAIWRSIFTHDLRRYRDRLYLRMHEMSTLIVGPSGSGKELVASAIGQAGYVPYDRKRRCFEIESDQLFQAVNIAALSPTLIESELFGHAKGAFTGAVSSRIGYLEDKRASQSVFFDEIGDLEPELQVKLLRVFQSRSFQRVGEAKTRRFGGKVIAATHRDLPAEIAAGRFREDLYYRLCADVIRTPSLREQLNVPGELEHLVRSAVLRVVGEEAQDIVDDVLAHIREYLGSDYDWPGNVRELEQVVRRVMIHGRAAGPAASAPRTTPGESAELSPLLGAVNAGGLTADALLDSYAAHVYGLTGSYSAAARRLGLDRRTVRRHVQSHRDR